jgi:hypothetical protein
VTFSDGRYAVICYNQAGQRDSLHIAGLDGVMALYVDLPWQFVSVTGLSGDRFMVAAAVHNGFDNDLLATIYDSNGNILKADFRLNGLKEGDQTFANVTSLQNGGFAVAYLDTTGLDIGMYIALFDADGNRVGEDHLLYSNQDRTQIM